jgi:dolichol-phosphate mannosyltransferase
MTDASSGRLRTISITPVLNEEQRIGQIVREMSRDWVDEVLVVSDGSTDRTEAVARENGAEVVVHPSTMGVGAAIRTGIHHAIERGCEAVVITSGSGKTRSSEVPRLLQALAGQKLDMAQGSRYTPGGYAGNMPLQRRIGTRAYSAAFSVLAGRWVTDASSGFRAMRASFLADPRIKLDQEWLNRYELEPYLLYKAITLGYAMEEVPVSIDYPEPIAGVPYTRIRAVVDWWRLLRPAVFLRMRLRK